MDLKFKNIHHELTSIKASLQTVHTVSSEAKLSKEEHELFSMALERLDNLMKEIQSAGEENEG